MVKKPGSAPKLVKTGKNSKLSFQGFSVGRTADGHAGPVLEKPLKKPGPTLYRRWLIRYFAQGAGETSRTG
jgi:hypothetical protein